MRSSVIEKYNIFLRSPQSITRCRTSLIFAESLSKISRKYLVLTTVFARARVYVVSRWYTRCAYIYITYRIYVEKYTHTHTHILRVRKRETSPPQVMSIIIHMFVYYIKASITLRFFLTTKTSLAALTKFSKKTLSDSQSKHIQNLRRTTRTQENVTPT